MMNTSLEGTESANSGDVSAVNDFRKIVLLRDPTKSASAVTSNTARLTKAIRIARSPTIPLHLRLMKKSISKYRCNW